MPVETTEKTDGLLTVRLLRSADATVVSLSGEMDAANVATARVGIEALLADTHECVIVDLQELSFIDSSGIALLVSLLRDDRSFLRLQILDRYLPPVERLLELTNVTTLIRDAIPVATLGAAA